MRPVTDLASPWIYTGGIDPYLWAPLPGVQTLDFRPFRLPLGPFAGLLADGNPHTIAVSVNGANNYFSAAGALYVTLDHGSTIVTGRVLRNTLTATPVVTTKVHQGMSGQDLSAQVATREGRDFTITGEATTSAGRVVTTVHEQLAFENDQAFRIGSTLYVQKIRQDTETELDETRRTGGQSTATQQHFAYPLSLNIVENVHTNGNLAIATAIQQQIGTTETDLANGAVTALDSVAETVSPSDVLLLNSQFQITGNKNQSSTATYFATSTSGKCTKRTLQAAGNVLTNASVSAGCH